MKPGRELDALVAEKVMGIVIPPDADAQYLETCVDLPHYSTDISAAWQVVEKLKAIVSELVIEISSSNEFPNEWDVSVKWYDEYQGCGPFYFTRATAPHALCLASLRTNGRFEVKVTK